MQIERTLAALGLEPKEVQIYLAMLALGMAPASVIARKARLKRATTYEILTKLSTRGIVDCFLRRKLKWFAAASPRALHAKFLDHVKDLGDALPELMASYNALRSKPRITYFEGKEDLQRLYLDVLNANGEVLNYFLPDKSFQYFGEEWIYKNHIAERVKRGIRLRAIVPHSSYADRFSRRKEQELRELRVIEHEDYFFTNETYIYGDRMSTFSYDEDFALLIESSDVVRTQRVLFELAWRSALVKG